jgi:hypothetical protein
MNKTQKSALFALSGLAIFGAISSYVFLSILAFRRMPHFSVALVGLLFFFAYLGCGSVVLRKKQSPAEPESDERDKIIMKNAVLVSFFSTWLFLAAVTVIAAILVGEDGSVSVYVLTLVNFAIIWGAVLIYFAAVLVQYALGGENGK